MAQYINKSALVAEIERRRNDALMRQQNLEAIGQETVLNEMVANELNKIISLINTLEVKEVDLEEEICIFFSKNPIPYERITDWPLLKNCAIYFFELGLKAQKGE